MPNYLTLKYFVLSPRKDSPYGEASRKALEAYANEIRITDPVLATEIKLWLKDVQITQDTHKYIGRTKYSKELILSKITTAQAALGGEVWNKQSCQCDNSVGFTCEYCAIFFGLLWSKAWITGQFPNKE